MDVFVGQRRVVYCVSWLLGVVLPSLTIAAHHPADFQDEGYELDSVREQAEPHFVLEVQKNQGPQSKGFAP